MRDLTEALQFHRAGRLQEAEDCYRAVIAADACNAQAGHLLGLLLLQTNAGSEEGFTLLRRAIELAPQVPDFHCNLAAALGRIGRHAEAAACLETALRLRPSYADAWNNLGVALEHLGRLQEAADAYGKAIGQKPDFPEPHNHLGNVLRKLGRLEEAIASHRRAIGLRADYAEAYNNLAAAYSELGDQSEVIACHREVVALRPHAAQARSDLLHVLHYSPESTQDMLFAEAIQWASQCVKSFPKHPASHANDRTPDRRLRVGYVSSDFREHPVARLIRPVLASHDRAQFEIFCYSGVRHPDATTAQLQSNDVVWRSVAGVPDDQLDQIIRRDRIDILIDLAGHMSGNRLTLFARKPAPVQITHFNYPDTTGLASIDYRITDPLSDPPGRTEQYSSERLLRLPDCAWCYHPGDDTPDVSPLPASHRGYLTFACLNKSIKITPQAVALWARVMHQIPCSRLLLHSGGAAHDNQYRRHQFEHHGINSDRLAFISSGPRRGYLAAYNGVDLAFDPFPYNGGVTSCDALWMGVPVITPSGDTYCSRQGVMLLTNLGLQGCIAESPDDFVARAIELTSDAAGLTALRLGLRERLQRSPLMNARKFTADLENAYHTALREWCSGHADGNPGIPCLGDVD
jgi:protein O-GlcNAc transferase